MALVGEALLSASVHVLVEKVVSPEFKDLFCSKELDPLILNKLKTTLLTLHAVLNDAEEKQIMNPAVQEWLQELRDVIYDADNLLDEINTRALRRKVEAESQTFSYHLRNFLSTFKQFCKGVNSELEILFQRLDQFVKEKDILGLKEGVSGNLWIGKTTTSVVDQSTIYGRDGDIEKLKKYLQSDDACNDHVGVITIVGMGGLGKTTLAQLLYNDREVKKHFNLKAWACITKEFDVVRVTRTLLESVNSKPIVANNLDALQVELQQSLYGRKFLFVLDDLWDTYNDWNRLKAILKAGDVGSKVIITTRQENVALAMHTFPIHNLMPLSHQDCWDLLAKHAFGANQSNKDPKLEKIGREIAAKCDGLPLAAEALGGLLRIKLSEKDWNKILKSNIWDLPNNKVLPPLLLSYHYLPVPLKGCFAFCSIFPKNYELDKETVVKLWMAEGLIQFKRNQSLEETGDEYFDELVSRSLIQKSTRFYQYMFKMHDLINDLATVVSGKYCFRYEDPKPNNNSTQHLSHLKIFHVTNCPRLDSFPLGGLPTPNLEKFYVHTCENLKCLPEWINTFTGLQELSVYQLPCLESFAEQGLPFNLRKLEIIDCGAFSMTSITQWGTQWLTFLLELTVGGDDLVDALMKKLLLPTSLVSLCIKDISFLNGEGIQHLTSLENLQIVNCLNLKMLPEKELLPLSLSVLSISECPLLQDTYQRNGGIHWPKISHIPCIKINKEVII
ncbi:putative disease resistance RPP13 protein 1 [Spatholobus suberectus]|nr:putative disease resistance RPP13 protein 1 [Spatholobus suberectus]